MRHVFKTTTCERVGAHEMPQMCVEGGLALRFERGLEGQGDGRAGEMATMGPTIAWVAVASI